MSNGSDPTAVLAALDRAQDAFEMVGRGRIAFEEGISAGQVPTAKAVGLSVDSRSGHETW